MKKSDLIKELLANFEVEKALQIAEKLDLNVRNLASNPVFMRAFFQNLLTETRFYKEEVNFESKFLTEKKVGQGQTLIRSLTLSDWKVSTSQIQNFIADSEQIADDFPEHYPIVLQELMIDARRKVAHKQFLSNSLYDLAQKKADASSTVKQILILEGQITEIYEDKKYFDQQLILPAKYAKNQIPETEKEDLRREYNNLKANISKTKAKLLNPSEKNKPILQAKLKEFEKKRMALAIKLDLQK